MKCIPLKELCGILFLFFTLVFAGFFVNCMPSLNPEPMTKNVFEPEVVDELSARIDKLNPETQPLWGTMAVGQMLAHCCVTYEMVFTDKHPKPNAIMGLLLRTFIKRGVVNEKPYPKNGQTAPAFKIKDDKDFESEKTRLLDYLHKVQELGRDYFEGKPSLSFGKLSAQEWNNLFYKHLDHHLRQFGV